MLKILLVLLAVSSCVIATDIFVRPQGCPSDVRLIVDDSYRELVNNTVEQCAAQCIADGTFCRSFSYYDNPSNLTKTCSLNIGHTDEVWAGLRYAQYWSYYERITEMNGIANFGIANITSCQPNTFRDCKSAYMATNNKTSRQIWMKMDNRTNAIPAWCRNGADLVMFQRSGMGFYDLSWNRPWEEYKWGFGRDLNNFWFGLDNMYRIINQDAVLRIGTSGRCIFPRKINGTTIRLALTDTLQGRCPWWSLRPNGMLTMSTRSLCICEDTINAQGTGHAQLCGCNEPNRYQFTWQPFFGLIYSRRPSGTNRCLKINADAGGEEIIVTDCYQDDSWQRWYFQRGRYRNVWGGWDVYNTYRESSAVHTQMADEPWSYRLNSDVIYQCGGLWAKVNRNMPFSTYDHDLDPEGGYNIALRQAGGDWLNSYGNAYTGEPHSFAMKDVSYYNFCGNWLYNAIMFLQADEYWY